ncbi:MAG: phenylacetate--CoA ligase family protein [Methylomonas sp.]|nr:phenylacetate--CoA ligase family protein [Methylomonas sp.]PPD19754.1 MAG: capsule biosynthesis protein CapK [Methylomonas sp.]PPD25577.1 MAG: capsule biosynthesis protein CapK [Methylomonas sp.]PPD36477.1 MAG: capsule biosynthesis protein CapK [Methylomonas sp.]PPD40954.1 MAG: capsule biosynthesis protein CapK [Methylomonas sp.]
MSFYTNICSNLLFPLHERLKRHTTVKLRRDMENTQWKTRDEIAAQQSQSLKTFLTDVGQHVPYYRKLFAERGFDPASVTGPQALAALPLLDKATIRAHLPDMRADDAVGLSRFNTGGSSGEPLIFYIGRRRVSHDVAAKWRATRWWGVDIGDTEAVVWGSPIELGAQDYLRFFRDKLLRTHLIPAFEMSPEKLDAFIRQLRKIRPKMLFGYPSALAHIAQHAERKGVAMNDLGIKVAFVTSERLYDHQREKIESIFGCPVANGYGGRDAGFIAHQCPSGGLHITADDIIVEIVDANGQLLPAGELGEIVVTHLATRDFPFIRYRTGDMGVLSDKTCACGRGLPLLDEVQGRTTDFVVAQDGTVLHGLALIYVLRDMNGVDAFKIVQDSLQQVTVLIVANPEYAKTTAEQRIQDEFKKRLGAGVDVVIQYVDFIAKERSGKFRYVISHVRP